MTDPDRSEPRNGAAHTPPRGGAAQPPDAEAVTEVSLSVGPVPRLRGALLALLLFAGTLLALFGVIYVARGAPVHGVVVEGLRSLPPEPGDPLFARMIETHTRFALPGVGTMEILVNGDGTFPRMWADISAAERSVTVQMYYFTPGALADTLAARLIERAQSGVRVLMLLDAFGARKLRPAYLRALRDAGVEIAHLRPFNWYRLEKSTHRTHVRGVVVDGRVGYTGGYGFGDLWLGDGVSVNQWRETNVRITGAAVNQLQASFMAGWAEVTGELLTGDLYFSHQPEGWSADRVLGDTRGASAPAGVFHFEPTLGSAAAERFLALSIASARRTLFITNAYFVPDDQFRTMLVAASKRGVDVRVLTAGAATDIPIVRYAGRAHYEELLRGGVRIYEYAPTMMHAKTLVVDGVWGTVGSLNFDNRSISYNDEANFVTQDSAFGARLDSLFLADIARSDEITLDGFTRRGMWARVKEWFANVVSAVL